MGLHLPGAAFVNPNTPLRDALTAAAAKRALAMTALGNDYTPAVAKSSTSAPSSTAIVALHATGGSTNHVHPSRRHGARRRDDPDRSRISTICRKVVPLLARIYPNGSADVNHFTPPAAPAF